MVEEPGDGGGKIAPDDGEPDQKRDLLRLRNIVLALLLLASLGALVWVAAGWWEYSTSNEATRPVGLSPPSPVPATTPPPVTRDSPAAAVAAPEGTSRVLEKPVLATPEPVRPPVATPQRTPAAVEAPTGRISLLRVGIRGPIALPPDAQLVVTTTDNTPYITLNSQATLRNVQSGDATVEVRTATRTLATARLRLVPDESVLVFCEALSADFAHLSCRVE